MAIAPTGAFYKALSFDSTSSRSYGVYITGEAVYNAPERAVEMISIPGRNGSFALDQGRFENIEVTYPAGIFAESEADFAQAISDFRNFLCSKKGYCRLTDEYNPNEYRLAVYKSGLEVDPVRMIAGEFEISFECKPQRYLTSGETAVSVTSGDTLTNPTLFESNPLLVVEGLGTIEFNSYTIERNDAYLGDVVVLSGRNTSVSSSTTTRTYTMDLSQLNTGDDITVSGLSVIFHYDATHISGASITSTSNATANATVKASREAIFTITCNDKVFNKGTSGTVTCTAGVSATRGGTAQTGTEQIVIAYDGTSTLTITVTMATLTDYTASGICKIPNVIGYSTISTVTQETYIDCDTGEAYYIVGGEYISVNDAIELPADLPKLASGSNTITYDNTITSCKITPRWWKV